MAFNECTQPSLSDICAAGWRVYTAQDRPSKLKPLARLVNRCAVFCVGGCGG